VGLGAIRAHFFNSQENSMYDRDKTIWETADGDKILIKDLTTPHIVNILNWMRKQPSTYSLDLYSFMEQEAELRKFVAFVANGAIPVKLDDGSYKVTNLPFLARCKSLYYKYKTEFKLRIQRRMSKTWISRKLQSIKSLKYNRLKREANRKANQ